MEETSEMGKNIKRMREERRWTQEELGAKLGITDRAVSAWEHGRAFPKFGMINELCRIFNCSLADLSSSQPSLREETLKYMSDDGKEMDIDVLSADYQRVMTICKALSPEQRSQLLDYAIKLMTEGK